MYFQLLILFLLVKVPPSQTLFSFDHMGRTPLNGCKKTNFTFFSSKAKTNKQKNYWALNNENVAWALSRTGRSVAWALSRWALSRLGTQSPGHSVAPALSRWALSRSVLKLVYQ